MLKKTTKLRTTLLSLSMAFTSASVFANDNSNKTEEHENKEQPSLIFNAHQAQLSLDGINNILDKGHDFAWGSFVDLNSSGLEYGVQAIYRFNDRVTNRTTLGWLDDNHQAKNETRYNHTRFTMGPNGNHVFHDRKSAHLGLVFNEELNDKVQFKVAYERNISNQMSKLFGKFGNNISHEFRLMASYEMGNKHHFGDTRFDYGARYSLYKDVKGSFFGKNWSIGPEFEWTNEDGFDVGIGVRKVYTFK